MNNDAKQVGLIKAVDAMIEQHGKELVGGLFPLCGHDPAAVAYVLSDAYQGMYPSFGELAEYFLASSSTYSDDPEQLKHVLKHLDAEEYVMDQLIGLGDEPTLACLCNGSQFYLFNMDAIGRERPWWIDKDHGGSFLSNEHQRKAGESALAVYAANNKTIFDNEAGRSLPALIVGNKDLIQAMTYEQLTRWADINDFPPSDGLSGLMRAGLNTYLGINAATLRGHMWIESPEQLMDWSNPDVRDLLSAHYGEPATEVAESLWDGEKKIYALAEGFLGTYSEIETDLEVGLGVSAKQVGSMGACSGTIGTNLRKCIENIWREHGSDSFGGDDPATVVLKLYLGRHLNKSSCIDIVNYSSRFPVMSNVGETGPFVLFDKKKINAATHQDCVQAAEKTLGALEHNRSNNRVQNDRAGR